MWSYRLNKIKSSNLDKSITNSTSLAEEQVDQTLINAPLEQHYASFFSKMGNWYSLIELFAASVVLALVLVLAETQGWSQFNFYHFLKYLLFIDWVLFALIAIHDHFKNIFLRMRLSRALMTSFLLLQILVILTTIALNFLLFFGEHLSLETLTLDVLLKNTVLYLSYGVLLGAFCFRYLYVREQWIRQQHSELQAKIDALQARIHPHFLFNSLNNVVSLIATQPEKAENLLLNLSRLFRASLQEFKLINLLDEIELSKKYLEIEQNRLGERLNIEWKFVQIEKFSQVKIPLLTLQPLLENSIFHGVEKILAKSTICILIEIFQNNVNIVITNPYVPANNYIRQHHGIAIKNVKERLEAYYGKSVIFRTHESGGIYTTVIQYQYQ